MSDSLIVPFALPAISQESFLCFFQEEKFDHSHDATIVAERQGRDRRPKTDVKTEIKKVAWKPEESPPWGHESGGLKKEA